MPVGRPPAAHMYHNGLPSQMQVMPNAVNMYAPPPAPSSSAVPRADGPVAVNSETWSDASSKLSAASSAPPVADHRQVKQTK